MRTLASFAVCTVLAFPLAAEPLDIRPGLWEFTQTMTPSGAPIYVEGMTAAQRESYAKTWAATVGKPTTETDRQCVTAQDIADAKVLKDIAGHRQCTRKIAKETKTALSATVDCKDGKTSMHTQVDYHAPSPDRLTGQLKASTESPNGTTVFDFRFSGKWLAPSCPKEDEDEESADDDQND